MSAAIVEHRAPTGHRRRDAQSQKAHRSFSQNSAGHTNCRLHDDRLNHVGQNVPGDYPPIARAESAGSFHKFSFARGQNLRPHQPGVAHPASE